MRAADAAAASGAMPTQALTIPAGELTLEGALDQPDGHAESLVVVCHHPHYGGDMDNNVVAAVARGLVEAGIGALRFNFRGVGRSSGSHDGGNGEQDDVRAALDYARALPDVQRVGLGGYSFGAGMAAAAVDDSIAALALVSLPSSMVSRGLEALKAYTHPVLLITGDRDHVSSPETLAALALELPKAEAHAVPGADHFWRGYEPELADAVREFFIANLSL